MNCFSSSVYANSCGAAKSAYGPVTSWNTPVAPCGGARGDPVTIGKLALAKTARASPENTSDVDRTLILSKVQVQMERSVVRIGTERRPEDDDGKPRFWMRGPHQASSPTIVSRSARRDSNSEAWIAHSAAFALNSS